MKLITAVEKWNRSLSMVLAFGTIAIVGVLGYITGSEISLSPLYLITIAVIAWKGGRWFGIAGAAVTAAVWAMASVTAGQHYSGIHIMVWNAVARFLTYSVMALLVASLKKSVAHLEEISRTDPLTGAANSRAFIEMLEGEIERSRRYQRPFTLSYLDLDNFKSVNDALGHAMGDALLRTVVTTIRSQMRATDVVARLGGDEFALLLPESDQGGARAVINKIRSGMDREMQSQGWPVTLSVGSVTCLDAWRDVRLGADDLIRKADALMYEVKVAGKNMASYSSLRAS
jgi:diguanylate cyclase (GGDEF)-like protein